MYAFWYIPVFKDVLFAHMSRYIKSIFYFKNIQIAGFLVELLYKES